MHVSPPIPLRGFSLVELSIVLVILGLLVGGVMAGQSLIKAAQLRAIPTEFARYQTAIYAFRDKYMALPGDFNKAYDFWGETAGCTNVDVSGDAAGCNGNANGQITSGNNGESARAWQHLALAGLIEGTYSGQWNSGTYIPQSKLPGGNWSLKYWGIADHGWTTSAIPPTGAANMLMISSRTLRPDDAWSIDMKLDDGKATSGFLYAHSGNNCTTTTDWATAVYNLGTDNSCGLLFILR